MQFSSITSQNGSIGYEMNNSHLVDALRKESRKRKDRKTPLDVVQETINTKNLSKVALDKYAEYLEKISTMKFDGAISYTINFCKKGLKTYIPVGSFN